MAAPRDHVEQQIEHPGPHDVNRAHPHENKLERDGAGQPSSSGSASSNNSFAKINAEHFDEQALTYEDRPGARELARRAGNALRRICTFDEDTTMVLDFACGVGMLSRELAPFSKSIVGVDISKKSVDEYNRRVENQGLLPEEMRAIATELRGENGELDNTKFDIAVCSMAYHHFEHPDKITRMLTHFLKPGGRLLVVDLMNRDCGKSAPVIPGHRHHCVAHRHGFSEMDMRQLFEGAGLVNFHYGRAFSALIPQGEALQSSIEDRNVHFFIAQGEKSAV